MTPERYVLPEHRGLDEPLLMDQGGPYDIHIEFDGRLSVCDGALNVLATFAPEFYELAEEMRDRLNIRHVVRIANLFRCGVCQRPAISRRIPLGGDVVIYTHEGGTECERDLS